MLKTAAAYLLVPTILFQGLGHVHAGAGSCLLLANDQHHAPHIHLGLILPAQHHDDQDESPDPSDDHHDDDAIYVPALVVMLTKPAPTEFTDFSLAVLAPEIAGGTPCVMAPAHFQTHSLPLPDCPIYLRVLSLLI